MKYDRDFTFWLNFFKKEKPSLNRFLKKIYTKDTYFLNNEYIAELDNEDYQYIKPGGLIENDFQTVLTNSNPKEIYYKTRIAIFLKLELDLSPLINRIGLDNFHEVIEKSLIDGHYEEFGINFEDLIKIAIKKYKLPIQNLVDVSLLRGVNLGSRYRTEDEEKKLKILIFKNKFKRLFVF